MIHESGHLSKIAQEQDYLKGFNSRLGEYRLAAIADWLNNTCLTIDRKYALEVGVGKGQIAEYLVGEFDQVDLIEPAQNCHKVLKHKFGSLINDDSIKKGVNLYKVCFEEFETTKKYNAIFMIGLLEHVINPLLILRKALHLLALDGCIIIMVPNADSLHRQIGVDMEIINNTTEITQDDAQIGHRRWYTWSSLMNLIIDSGLYVIHGRSVLLKPFPNVIMDLFNSDYMDALYRVSKRWDYHIGAELLMIGAKKQ
jgi:2-polyprenyl-3-methyl-5-hydroxy-6-metoxy-1,4-benzoquinol methylase